MSGNSYRWYWKEKKQKYVKVLQHLVCQKIPSGEVSFFGKSINFPKTWYKEDLKFQKLSSFILGGCYYRFQHYENGDQIITNEPCLNCTCQNNMLMCFLKVCPYVKPVGKGCTVEKDPKSCCPKITCPQGKEGVILFPGTRGGSVRTLICMGAESKSSAACNADLKNNEACWQHLGNPRSQILKNTPPLKISFSILKTSRLVHT